uniref:Uncharacterized protein n=1 Tax=Faecalibaculum rodentium TaxID=1702221 RepID=A0A140DSW8_9FIRM|nr:hypothetical protein AALO17_06110 [Faecalibaculum rodentium]
MHNVFLIVCGWFLISSPRPDLSGCPAATWRKTPQARSSRDPGLLWILYASVSLPAGPVL